MTEFFLQYGITDSARLDYKKGRIMTLPDKREFIDDRVHGKGKTKNKVIVSTVKPDWIQARAKLAL